MPKLVAGSSLGFDDFTLIRVRVSLFVIYLLIDQAESFEEKAKTSCFLKEISGGVLFSKTSPLTVVVFFFRFQRDHFQKSGISKKRQREDSPTKYAITTIKLKKT